MKKILTLIATLSLVACGANEQQIAPGSRADLVVDPALNRSFVLAVLSAFDDADQFCLAKIKLSDGRIKWFNLLHFTKEKEPEYSAGWNLMVEFEYSELTNGSIVFDISTAKFHKVNPLTSTANMYCESK